MRCVHEAQQEKTIRVHCATCNVDFYWLQFDIDHVSHIYACYAEMILDFTSHVLSCMAKQAAHQIKIRIRIRSFLPNGLTSGVPIIKL